MKKSEIFPLVEFVNKQDELPFEVKTVQGMNAQADDGNHSPHQHNYFEMLWLTKGEATCLIDLDKKTIENNQFIFIKPGRVHQFILSEDADGFVICFKDLFLSAGEYEFDLNCHSSLFDMLTGSNGAFINNDTKKDLEEIVLK